MPKDRTEHPNVKATAVPHPDHRLWCGFISDAQARSKIREAIPHVSLEVDFAKAGNVDQPGAEVQPTSSTRPGNRLRKVNFPSQSIVEYQFASDAEGVLAVEEPSLLTFSCILDAIYIPAE